MCLIKGRATVLGPQRRKKKKVGGWLCHVKGTVHPKFLFSEKVHRKGSCTQEKQIFGLDQFLSPKQLSTKYSEATASGVEKGHLYRE